MTTATETDVVSVSDLEELFGLEIPCGGNISPRTRPCPDAAAAVVRNSHRCRINPSDFKCLKCYTEWLSAGAYSAGWCTCSRCGARMRMSQMYVPL